MTKQNKRTFKAPAHLTQPYTSAIGARLVSFVVRRRRQWPVASGQWPVAARALKGRVVFFEPFPSQAGPPKTLGAHAHAPPQGTGVAHWKGTAGSSGIGMKHKNDAARSLVMMQHDKIEPMIWERF